jgi:hypothetical protein
MTTTNTTRLRTLRSDLVSLGGTLSSMKASFARTNGALSHLEAEVFRRIEDAIINTSIFIDKRVEEMDEADYQQRNGGL